MALSKFYFLAENLFFSLLQTGLKVRDIAFKMGRCVGEKLEREGGLFGMVRQSKAVIYGHFQRYIATCLVASDLLTFIWKQCKESG